VPDGLHSILAMLVVLLSMSEGNDMLHCYHIIVDLPKDQLALATRISTLPPAALSEIRSCIAALDFSQDQPTGKDDCFDSHKHSCVDEGSPLPYPQTGSLISAAALSAPQGSAAPTLFIAVQPPEVCVSKRNVKPAPTLLVSNLPIEEQDHYCVVPKLYRCDLSADETQSLAGREHAAIPANRIVTFRKLKIQVTSRMLFDSPLLLGFELRRYAVRPFSKVQSRGSTADDNISNPPNSPPSEGEHEYTVVHSIMSTPIIVVSHSSQLHAMESTLHGNHADPGSDPAMAPMQMGSRMSSIGGAQPDGKPPKKKGKNAEVDPDSTPQLSEHAPKVLTANPQCSPHLALREVLPSHGLVAGGTRVILVGDGFTTSEPLSVFFGGVRVTPVILGPRSLLCVTPAVQAPSVVKVSVKTPTTEVSGASFKYD